MYDIIIKSDTTELDVWVWGIQQVYLGRFNY